MLTPFRLFRLNYKNQLASSVHLCAIAVAAALLIGFFLYGCRHWKSAEPIDHVQFWVVGEAISKIDVIDIYDRQEQAKIRNVFLRQSAQDDPHSLLTNTITKRKNFNLAGTPFLYSCFALFASGNYSTDYRNYRIFCLVAYLVSIIYLCRVLKFGWIPSLLFPLFFSEFFWPFKVDVRFCNVNQLQVATVALAVFIQKNQAGKIRHLLSGIVLGLALMFKPNIPFSIGLLIVMWCGERRKEVATWTVGGIFMGILTAFILPTVLFGSACSWTHWFPTFGEIVFRKNYFNASLLGMFFPVRFTWPYKLLGIVLFSIASWAVATKKIYAGEERVILPLGLGLVIYILCGPLVHAHYFLLVIPSALWLLRPDSSKTNWKGFLSPRHVITILSLVLIAPLGFRFARPWHPNFLSYMGVLMLFAGTVGELYLSRNSRFVSEPMEPGRT